MDAETVGAGFPAGGGLAPTLAQSESADDPSRALSAARQASVRLAHLARRMAAPRMSQVPPELRDIVEAHRDYHPRADIGALVHAYGVAERLHAGQMRRSGDPYISHPLAVTEALAELGVDTTTLIAALLHDTVEDTGYSLGAVTEEFGGEVANLVDGVTKLDKMRFGEAAEAETLRKLIVALARDYRVLVIKIADRLHNMRTLDFMSPAKQVKISRVTLEILAPLAHRLGVSVIKRELEDRAFAVLHPAEYARIATVVDEFSAAERQSAAVAAMVSRLRSGLASARIDGEVAVRASHLFSIYKRAQERARAPRDYTDIVRVLVLVDEITDCYAALGVIHALWRPVPGRLRDFVATPKFNMYQSLHTTVVDDGGRSIDIQIRTSSMHQLAETGIIARPVGAGADGARLEGLSWLHSLLDWQEDTVDSDEFLESLSSDLESDEVLAFTPRGKMIALPARSSPVDVAYAVHTDVGHRAIGARVNGRLVPLHTRLRNGDVVEILTSNLSGAGPSEDWLRFVKTSRARVRIRRHLARVRRVAASPPTMPAPAGSRPTGFLAPEPANTARTPTSTGAPGPLPVGPALLAGTGRHADPAPGADNAAASAGPVQSAAAIAAPRGRPAGLSAVAEDRTGARTLVRLARCCLPLPGDAVVGLTTHGNVAALHRRECANATEVCAERERVPVTTWTVSQVTSFPAEIAVEAFDRYGLLADITEALSETSVSVRAASTTTSDDLVAHARFTLEVTGLEQLGRVLAAVRRVGGVYDCYRACQTQVQPRSPRPQPQPRSQAVGPVPGADPNAALGPRP
ncbi:putative GTP pyrophosphokinase [Frankia sp. AiPs1]|uniref:RelA/SpoT family protein n=1 Tax=Frankia sp. AiPa1 TaxID=573492 RepID=UPI00202B14E2|nr:bifunctional (p)ppGpp synthetase/guanosine-3',5'-bis(diphosphate) 3'-pyrophosphohydrolase [Frankia sp. AiPa1]MCL9757999.1 bifunctional (p)ppGpp synthetase/guanosine-3',5'-bis(diphosphate) 3'-pyrophosphohydrolase [Frankia sp. AiPa1]